jgi:hypothetical protein
VINAGTLCRDQNPCFLEVDFEQAVVDVYTFDEMGRVVELVGRLPCRRGDRRAGVQLADRHSARYVSRVSRVACHVSRIERRACLDDTRFAAVRIEAAAPKVASSTRSSHEPSANAQFRG